MPGNVTISTSSVPIGFCFTDWAASWPQLVALLSAEADLSVNLHIGEAAPTDLAKAWLKTISGVPDRVYYFASGVWLSKHDWARRIGASILAPAGTALADIDTFDGGEAGAVTAFSGPMWVEDTDFRAMFPIGPGTLPSGTVIAEGDTGGEEKHSLTIPEIPPHTHALKAKGILVDSNGPATGSLQFTTISEINSEPTGGDLTTGLVVPHNTMPPYRSRFFLRKTSRTHYRG